MSKHHQWKRPSRPDKPLSNVAIETEKQKRINTILFLSIALILAAIPFALGKYLEFKAKGAFDSGAYVYSAYRVVSGAKIGIDEVPTAALGTLLVNMLGVKLFGFNEIGPELVQMLMQAAALIMMFFVMRKLFGNLPAAIGLFIASAYLSAPMIAKYGNVKEQYMIAVMILAACSLVLYHLNGKFWWALLAGGFAVWAPLFKPTGVSVIIAIAIFTIAQPFFKNKTFKQTGIDCLLLFAGAAIALAPAFIWIIGCNIKMNLPYQFAWDIVTQKISSFFEPAFAPGQVAKKTMTYIAAAKSAIPFEVYAPRILRYYMILSLPIVLALSSICARLVRLFLQVRPASRNEIKPKMYDKFVLFFAVWWITDMALVWVSPRAYEEYFLPLNGSGAMLSGYIVALYCDKLKNTFNKPKWIFIGLAAFICMIVMIWPIFFGIKKSPFSNTPYLNYTTGQPERSRGYLQKLKEVDQKGSWEYTADYIKNRSTPKDKIFVWGWVPGIYVYSQRIAPTPAAFFSEMHMTAPDALAKYILDQVAYLQKDMPKFIVDTQKRETPWDRPPLALWPKTQKGFLPNDKNIINFYEKAYAKDLSEKIEPAEAQRFNAMKPMRDFVMDNYQVATTMGEEVIFELKSK